MRTPSPSRCIGEGGHGRAGHLRHEITRHAQHRRRYHRLPHGPPPLGLQANQSSSAGGEVRGGCVIYDVLTVLLESQGGRPIRLGFRHTYWLQEAVSARAETSMVERSSRAGG